MNNHETLFTYITQERARGVSDDAIRTALIAQGWQESQVRTMMRTALTLSGAQGFTISQLFRGRIGRLKYFGAGVLMALVYAVFVMLLAFAGLYVQTEQSVGYIMTTFITVLVYATAAPFSLGLSVRRAHDIGWTGWSVGWMLVPFLGFIYALILLLRPGQPSANLYGPPPNPNQGWFGAIFNR